MERLTDSEILEMFDHASKKSHLLHEDYAIIQAICELKSYRAILLNPDGTERISMDRLKELVEADADGRCAVLPCKVGQTVYKVSYDCTRGARYNPFNEYGISTAKICLKCDTYPCDLHKAVIPVTAESEDWIWKNRVNFGKTIFLAREEAEAALKKGEK